MSILTLKNLFLFWLLTDAKLLMVIGSEHCDGPDLTWGGRLTPPGHCPHVHNVIHLIHLGPQYDATI